MFLLDDSSLSPSCPQLPSVVGQPGDTGQAARRGWTAQNQGPAFVGVDVRAWTGLGAAPLAARTLRPGLGHVHPAALSRARLQLPTPPPPAPRPPTLHRVDAAEVNTTCRLCCHLPLRGGTAWSGPARPSARLAPQSPARHTRTPPRCPAHSPCTLAPLGLHAVSPGGARSAPDPSHPSPAFQPRPCAHGRPPGRPGLRRVSRLSPSPAPSTAPGVRKARRRLWNQAPG